MYGRLLRFLRPYRALMVVTVLCRIIAAALEAFSFVLLIPFLGLLFQVDDPITPNLEKLRGLLEVIVPALAGGDRAGNLLPQIIILILGTTVLKNFFVWWSGQTGAKVQEYVARDMRDQVYAHMIRLPMAYHAATKAGQSLSRVLADTETAKLVITQFISQSLQNVATLIAYVALLISLSGRLTVVALIIAPLVILALQPLLKRLRSGYRRLTHDRGELTSLVHEVLTGARLVKSFGTEKFEEDRYTDASHRYSRGLVKVARYTYLSQPITEVIGALVAVCLLWLGAREVLITNSMEGAEVIAFLIAVLRLLQPLKQLSQLPAVAQASAAASERVFGVMDQPAEAELDRGSRDVDGFNSGIRFEAVSFTYGDEYVLRDISFEVQKGEVLALVGPSGAGKSTLVDLLPRFYEPSAGRILLDGVDLRDLRLPSLRSCIGIVSQETVLFNDTVRNNIAYGASGRYSQSEVERAAELANAHGFISELPQGYDTVLGERGMRLSGGQRQRISIARALLANPPILIFDEATSALDSESERLVQEAMERLLTGRTVLVIAHRLSTVTHADQILVLDRGRVVESGRHAELLERDGMYARLYGMQFQAWSRS